MWSPAVGIVSLVGANFHRDLIDRLAENQIDVKRIRFLELPLEHRFFYACPSPGEKTIRNPSSHYLRRGLPLPKGLIDLPSPELREEPGADAVPLASVLTSLPPGFGADCAVHFCAADLQRSVALPSRVRDLGVSVVTLDPDTSFMNPDCLRGLPAVVKGLSAVLPSLEELRELFSQSSIGEWEMAEALSDMGCEIVAIKCGAEGQRVWDRRQGRRWMLPAYPARVRDIHGAGDAFCGGFLAGLAQTGDPLEASLRGSVSASLAIEGTGALYPLDILPGLVEARLDFLRQMAKAA
jgi:ribokinase